MELFAENFTPAQSDRRGILQAMYESPALFNEGLSSFEYPLYHASDEELDHFLGDVVSGIGHAVSGAAKAVGKVVPVEGIAKTVGKAVSAVDKVVPVSMLTSGLAATPLGMAVRAGLGAAQALADGRNVFQGAVRSLVPDIGTRFFVDTAMGAARGENVFNAAQRAFQAGIGDVRKSLQFAAMVAPFVPGVGTGVAAALGAANALAAGQPISDAVIAAARDALPGGAIAQVAFDTAMNLAKGKNIGEALLNSARAQLPGGPAAQAAFDAALTLAKGKSIQDAAFAAAGHLLPPSPYAADALSFVKKVASGENIQRAALSTVGNAVLNKIEQQGGPLLSNLRARLPQVPTGLPGGWPTQFAAGRSAIDAALAAARTQRIRDAARTRAQRTIHLRPRPLLRSRVPAPHVAGKPTFAVRPLRPVRYAAGRVAAPGTQVVGHPGVVTRAAAPGGYVYPPCPTCGTSVVKPAAAPPTPVPGYGRVTSVCPPCPACGAAVDDQEMGQEMSFSGWQVWCPEENAQIGPTFYSSDQAFQVSSAHNSAFGHNSTVVPCTNC
jgi:hypothetical protein